MDEPHRPNPPSSPPSPPPQACRRNRQSHPNQNRPLSPPSPPPWPSPGRRKQCGAHKQSVFALGKDVLALEINSVVIIKEGAFALENGSFALETVIMLI